MRKVILIWVLFLTAVNLFGQGELDDQEKILYRNERTWAFLLNTNGWGGSFRYGKRVDYFNKNLYEIDLTTLKDPKEFKYSSDLDSRSWVYGKLNSCFLLRFGYGRQQEIFQKFDKSGISIRFNYTGGVTFAVYKPVYYTVWFWHFYPDSTYSIDEQEQKFYDIGNGWDIMGKAAFAKGLNEVRILPGIYAKTGLTFEFSTNDAIVNAVEFGTQFDLFPKPVPIMANDLNRWGYLSFFICYRFGRVIDPSAPKTYKSDFSDDMYP